MDAEDEFEQAQDDSESSEYSEEEEEAVILVELTGLPNPEAFRQCKGTCSILGLDTEQPVMQLDNYTFKGKFEDALGTCLLFKQNSERKKLTYYCKTSKKLCMSRIILRKKEEETTSQDQSSEAKASRDSVECTGTRDPFSEARTSRDSA